MDDYFLEVGLPGSATTLAAPGYTIGNTGITVASTTNWPGTGKGVAFAIDRVDSNGVRIEGTYNEFVGTVSSGTSITDVDQVFGDPQNYAAGSTTRVYIPVSSERENRLVEGIKVQHNDDGTHANVITTNAINENTPANGVTIDGVNMRDSKINTASAVDNVALSTGMVVQMVSTTFSAVATGSITIPFDDTIPQNTEGDQYITQAITPKSATNILLVEVVAVLASSTGAGDVMSAALFQDNTASAIAATTEYMGADNLPVTVKLGHSFVAGTTSAITFKVRAGSSAAGTTTFNGSAGTRLFGAITKSFIKVTEYKA